jgi:hypothetical protein
MIILGRAHNRAQFVFDCCAYLCIISFEITQSSPDEAVIVRNLTSNVAKVITLYKAKTKKKKRINQEQDG